jgi:hypothetical protein
MKKHVESHLDHDLSATQIAHIFARFADRAAFFIETIELPEDLGTVPCLLYGPAMNDAPVSWNGDPSKAHVFMQPRAGREYPSRQVALPARQTRMVTVIAGPHSEACDACTGQGVCTNPFAWYSHGDPNEQFRCIMCAGTGKIEHACILYTAFGGPQAPQEPGDPTCKDIAASTVFWSEHALGYALTKKGS